MSPSLSEMLGVDFSTIKPPGRLSSQIAVQPFTPSAKVAALPRLDVYIDETGDRGRGDKASGSPIFGMAGIVIDPLAEPAVRAALRQMRRDFRTPPGRPLSWKEDLKTHDRRMHAANLLAPLTGFRIVFVVVDKASLNSGSYRDNVTLLYNVVAFDMLARVLWAAKNWPGGARQAAIRFGHVAKHDHTDTHRYFQIKQNREPTVPFHLISSLTWVNAAQFDLSQVADVYAGFLKAGFWPNEYGDVEGAYLRKIWHQIRMSETCALNLGIRVKPDSAIAKRQPWWPCPGCQSKY